MILIFDLDDTLYDEMSFVRSGFHAVATHAQREWGWDTDDSNKVMLDILECHGRGAVFDHWLSRHQANRPSTVKDCVRIYRHHTPHIRLFDCAGELLKSLKSAHRLYIVTDGHKLVQANKVAALGLDDRIEKAYITHRYGIQHAKPSAHCFELIKNREACRWSDMAYVGDNPAKDFVGLNPLGVHTIRVLTGSYKEVEAQHGYDARHTLPTLEHLGSLISELQSNLE